MPTKYFWGIKVCTSKELLKHIPVFVTNHLLSRTSFKTHKVQKEQRELMGNQKTTRKLKWKKKFLLGSHIS